MSHIFNKVWGTTQKIFDMNGVQIHRIIANKGGYSSTHKHEFRFNMFYVERGSIKVIVHKNDYDLTDETIIKSGESTVAAPNEWHSFLALEDTVAYEIYYGKVDDSDIVRRDCGGIEDLGLKVTYKYHDGRPDEEAIIGSKEK